MLGQSPAFPAYTTATDRLMNSVGGVAGMGPEKLRDLVESTERPQRFNAIADAALDSQLGELVPESHRDQLRQDLTGPLRRGLRGLTMTEMSELTHPGSKQTWGERSAERTVHEFIGNLADVVDHYESWAEQNPGVDAPALPDSVREKFLDREEKTQQIWADAGWPAQQPVAGREQAYYQQLPDQRYHRTHASERSPSCRGSCGSTPRRASRAVRQSMRADNRTTSGRSVRVSRSVVSSELPVLQRVQVGARRTGGPSRS